MMLTRGWTVLCCWRFPAALVPALAFLAALHTSASSEECPTTQSAKDALEFASLLCINLPLLEEDDGLYHATAWACPVPEQHHVKIVAVLDPFGGEGRKEEPGVLFCEDHAGPSPFLQLPGFLSDEDVASAPGPDLTFPSLSLQPCEAQQLVGARPALLPLAL